MERDTPAVAALEYVGLTTGFCRTYRPAPHGPGVTAALDDLIERAVRRPGAPVVIPGHPGFVGRLMTADDSLTLTITGPVAVGPVVLPLPVHALAVQAACPGSEELWRALHQDTGIGPFESLVTWGAAAPAAPWIASKPLLSAASCREDTGWVDAFGLELAWVWVRRRGLGDCRGG
jgi:hypothetical protein